MGRLTRRGLLRGAGLSAAAAASGMTWLSGSKPATAGGPTKRLLVLHRPNGTIRGDWLQGTTFGPILSEFEDLRPYMVVPDGLEIVTTNGGNDSHEGGLVTLMTGEAIGESRPTSSDDWKNTAKSIDQRLVEASAVLGSASIGSIQVGAHNRQTGGQEVANRALSYAGPDDPMYPQIQPALVFQQLFGSNPMEPEEAESFRAKQRSVLSYLGEDLDQLQPRVPSAQQELLDAHAAALADLEAALDGFTCDPGTDAPVDPPDTDYFADVGNVGEMQLELIRLAFACDRTRVATYMWSAGASRIQFEDLFPGMGSVVHHTISHYDLTDPSVSEPMAAIDRWFAQETAKFLRTLRDTTDFDGSSLLDNTLVLYISEVSAGSHTFDNMPILLFGGAGVGLEGDRVLDYTGRSTNDLWLSIAEVFDVDLSDLGEPGQTTGPLEGLFA